MKLLYERRKSYEFSYRVNKLAYPMHVDNAVEVFLCTRGSTTVQYGDQHYKLCPGDIFFCFPNQPHGYSECDRVEGYMFILPVQPLLAEYYNALMHMKPQCPVLRHSGWQQGELGTLVQMAYKERMNAPEPVMQGYFLVIVGKLLSMLQLEKGGSDTADAVRRIIFYLNDHYKEPVSRRSLAMALGYNQSYVSHIFSQTFRTSLPKYLSALRVNDACRLLQETELSVADIAASLGFGSIRSFNRVFLEQMGSTPREYRLLERAGQ